MSSFIPLNLRPVYIITLTSNPDVLKFEVEKLRQYNVYSCGRMQRDDVAAAARHTNVFVVVFVVVCMANKQ